MIIFTQDLSIGKQIQIKRIIEGTEQRDLAKRLGMHRTLLSKIENDVLDVPKKHWATIMDYLNQ